MQILIENAIKHNVANEEKPLTIEMKIEGDYLTVENNFQPKKNVETSNRLGLQNLISLYGFLTDHPVIIHQEEKFTVKIPLLEPNQLTLK